MRDIITWIIWLLLMYLVARELTIMINNVVESQLKPFWKGLCFFGLLGLLFMFCVSQIAFMMYYRVILFK